MEHEQNALPECSTAGAGAATSTADASTQLERWDVFISHAGEQTRSFACWLEQDLGRAGVKAFLDEHSLRLGDAADSIMEGAVRSAQIFICVLTPDYLRKRWTMQELRWALDQQQQPQQGRQLIIMPLFYGIDVDELKGHEALLQQHHPDHWQQYAADLAAVGRTMGLRKDVVDGFDNLYVKETVHQVLNQLERGPTLVADHPVVGDYLHSFRTVDEWQSELAFYESTGGTAHTDESVIKLLRRSFDILPNEQKHMFLDTATILHARPAGHLLAVWGSLPGSMPSAASMLGVLQSWSLVALDKKGNLSVHDSLRKMAQLVAAETAAAAWSLLTDVSQDTRQDPSAATRLQLSSPGRLRSLKGLLQAHPHAALVVIDSCPACGFHVFYPEVVSQQLLYLRTQLVDRRPRWSVNMGYQDIMALPGPQAVQQ
ncbi:hypothetical protein WJX72_011067 [[Myrmecia] bisecta]|uniref:ADP-ribosyl cyclase/cyclic ADP-ribose hydrolase n=1 Tax=[Myrmecia] bisecta TaxID=41462 RepID=A0AAW1PEG9_9CHLO